MQSPSEILADLWTLAGGELSALDAVTLTGEEPQLPSSFRVAAAAQASIAAAGLAAAQIWKLRSGQSQDVAVDIRHAKALAALPPISIEKIGDATPKPWPAGDRPLEGVRVLDLSRVIAGPVAGRTLAVHGADVLLIAGPDLPAIPWLTIDTGRGKLTGFVELKSPPGRSTLRDLLAGADIFSQRYRPLALANLGFSAQDAARINPGIIYVSLSAYGHAGPWPERRGFDSLVQTPTGFNQDEGQTAGVDWPKELPAQMLDHATAYLMAFGAMMARARQSREGGSW